MNRINRHIKAKLKENTDLFDTAHIDKTLTYSEQKAEIQEKLSLLVDSTTREKEAIQGTLKGLQSEQEQAIKQNLKHIHKVVRQGFKQLKTGQEITQLFNLNK